jgi:hypothetical protein
MSRLISRQNQGAARLRRALAEVLRLFADPIRKRRALAVTTSLKAGGICPFCNHARRALAVRG